MVMRFKPQNPNTAHKNRNTLYIAKSGGGKSQALAQNPAIPQTGGRVIMWDAAGDHPGLHFESRQKFIKALTKGIRSGRGFRVAYAGSSVEEFEWWCEVCWSVLDGDYLTHLFAEELSQVSPSVAKASPNAAVLLNQLRKYGGIFHGTTQKPQEVAKTFFDQCDHKYIGVQKGEAMCKKMAREIGLQPEQIASLNDLQFYHDCPELAEPELITLKYKKIQGVKWLI